MCAGSVPTAVPSRTDTLYIQIALERQKTSTERVHAAVARIGANSKLQDQRRWTNDWQARRHVLVSRFWAGDLPSARCGNLSGSAPGWKAHGTPTIGPKKVFGPQARFHPVKPSVHRSNWSCGAKPARSIGEVSGGWLQIKPREAALGFRMGEGLGERTAIVRCTKRARKGQSHFSSCLEPKTVVPTH